MMGRIDKKGRWNEARGVEDGVRRVAIRAKNEVYISLRKRWRKLDIPSKMTGQLILRRLAWPLRAEEGPHIDRLMSSPWVCYAGWKRLFVWRRLWVRVVMVQTRTVSSSKDSSLRARVIWSRSSAIPHHPTTNRHSLPHLNLCLLFDHP
jgi:hypothetical protein